MALSSHLFSCICDGMNEENRKTNPQTWDEYPKKKVLNPETNDRCENEWIALFEGTR